MLHTKLYSTTFIFPFWANSGGTRGGMLGGGGGFCPQMFAFAPQLPPKQIFFNRNDTVEQGVFPCAKISILQTLQINCT